MIPPDTMVVTSIYVTEQRLPILIVSHDDDGEGGSLWQFHCGNGDYETSSLQLVRLDTILALDPGIEHVLGIFAGETAIRQSAAAAWDVTTSS